MKIMTFNTQHCLNFIEQKIDFDIMAKTILDFDADIVGLNEMRGDGESPEYTAQVEKLAELTGMKYYYFAKAIDVPSGGPYGNGILSKIPIIKAETILIPEVINKISGRYYERRCVLKAVLEGNITVLVTHFGLTPDEQINATSTVMEHIADEKCILMGDFNLKPDNSIISPIREKMTDTASLFTSEKLSFPSDAPRSKIDYVFVSPDVKVIDADIPPVVASDHRPHTAIIDFQNMKKMNVALINNVQYCKFPDGITNISQFIEFLNKNYHSFVELEFFVEEGCVAPFYIEEDLKTEKEYVNPSNIRYVKESEALILSRAEYEKRLSKVIQDKCIHCVHYSENLCEQDLRPHIEHIDLNGDCYGYGKKE
ncbi:MAG: hypothetical protein E7613_08535 [Ruminococcaceae bacterium]|nr:hypothetical protein [Oscillospiraceae bacterium]